MQETMEGSNALVCAAVKAPRVSHSKCHLKEFHRKLLRKNYPIGLPSTRESPISVCPGFPPRLIVRAGQKEAILGGCGILHNAYNQRLIVYHLLQLGAPDCHFHHDRSQGSQ